LNPAVATGDAARRALRSVERDGRDRWRRRTIRRGTDVTDRAAVASCLVLAPHPDDETIGCGATIARKRAASTPVRVVVAADGRSSHRSAVIGPDELARRRSHEVVAACAALGVAEADVVQLGFRDDSLAGHQAELAGEIAAHLDDMVPDEVLVPSGRDWHPDHQALRRALDLALQGRRLLPRVLEYPVWFWVHGPWDADPGGPWASLRPRSFLRGLIDRRRWPPAEIVATAGFLGAKQRALRAHESQVTNLTGEPDWTVLDEEFLAAFLLPYEVAFPAARSGSATDPHPPAPEAPAG
jgi:LmbE family N-acetylglucosaminyl deacetylase